jgi:putative hydrolase of the HAD superfamily
MVPWSRIDTVFLDVGNTLISMDFDWVAREIRERGHACTPGALLRAEAAARPPVSELLRQGHSTEPDEIFVLYLRMVFENIDSLASAGREATEALAAQLLPVLRLPGRADRLWSSVLPGVPDALERLRALDLELVVVSNADGSVDRGLRAAGIRHYFSQVLDSAVVGYEKPDPRLFEEALRRSKSGPERTLHVGDLFHADVVGARSAGVHAVLLDPFGDWGDVDCPVFPDLAAVVAEIESHRKSGG